MIHNRRKFLKNSTALAAGTVLLPYCTSILTRKQVGIQLYTVRDQIKEDLEGTLKKVAAIGYDHVELADYADGKFYGMQPTLFKQMVEDTGMKISSSHIRIEPMMEDFDRALEALVATEQKYVAVPWLAPEKRNLDFYKQLAEFMNEKGAICAKEGIQMTYHNHDFEFESIDGVIPMELLLQDTHRELVKFELDLYWVVRAGKDPVQLFKDYPGRFPLWHVKDMADTPEKEFAEVGKGTINFKEIFDHAGVAGMDTFFVEQDRSDDPLASIETSYKNVQEIIS